MLHLLEFNVLKICLFTCVGLCDLTNEWLCLSKNFPCDAPYRNPSIPTFNLWQLLAYSLSL